MGLERGPISPTALFKKGQLATSIACPMLTAPTRLRLPAGHFSSVPPEGRWTFPGGSTDWALSLARPELGMAVLLPDGDVRGLSPPTILGLRVLRTPLAAVPVPRRPTKGWLRERCRVLPQRPGSHSASSSPYEDIIRGGGAPFGTSAPEGQKTRQLVPVSGPSEDVHLHPQGNASRPEPGSSNPLFNRHKPPTAWSGSNPQEAVLWWWIITDTALDLSWVL